MDCFEQIFSIILFATTLFEPTTTDCPKHNYNIGTKTFTWPKSRSNDEWIASNCLDQEKRLVFRKCINDIWTPNNTEFQLKCQDENVEHTFPACPYNFKPIRMQEKTICIRRKSLQYDFIKDKGVCIQDSIFTVELNIKEQTQLIDSTIKELANYNGLLVLGARWRYPCREISKYIVKEKESVELHDVRCGQFGLPLKFNDTVPVHCTKDKCENMCLYLNASTGSFSQLIDVCSEYVIAKSEKSFLHQVGCPRGYYRIEYDYVESSNHDSCFTIKMFPKPIPVENITSAKVIKSYCNENIMRMYWGDDLFLFRHLSEHMGLTHGNYCLFGDSSNRIVKYSDWDSRFTTRTPYLFNWDKTMNYSRIIAPGSESYLTVTPNGQYTWTTDSITCIVCMAKTPIPRAKLQLKYRIFDRKLELEVSNQDFLYKEKSSDLGFICFSLFRGVYKANLTVFHIAYGKYLIEDAGPGQYWCSGHNVINRIYQWTGERIFAYGIWFAFQVKRQCAIYCSFSSKDLNRFIELFKKNNGHLYISGSTFIEHEQNLYDTKYTFTALLSLTLHDNPKDSSVTNLLNVTDYELETLLIYVQMNKELTENSDEMIIESIKSTEYCLHESIFSIDTIIWQIIRASETVPISPLCPSSKNVSNLSRTCSGDSGNGLFWEKAMNVSHCYTNVSESLLKLYADFKYPSQTTAKFEYVKNLLSENVQKLLPLDVFLTSRVLLKDSIINDVDVKNIFSIYNSVLQVDESSLQISAFLNSTNILLETFENILLSYIKSSILSSNEFHKYGNYSIHSALIETFVLNPTVSGISGVALYRPRSSADYNFTTYYHRYIYSNETINDIMTDCIADKDLVVGSYIPMDMLTAHSNVAIVITAFFNDKLFQLINTTPITTTNGLFTTRSKIISITILGLDDSLTFPHKVPIFFESNRSNVSTCNVWNFRSIKGWSSNGCSLKEIFDTEFQHIALCDCPLSTRIVYLMDGNIHDYKRKIVTVVTSSFSFLATIVIFLTAVVSKEWRKQLSSKIFINFSLAITLEMTLMIFMSFDDYVSVIAGNKIASFALGSTLNYSSFALHSWVIIFVYFQLKRYDTVLNFNGSHLLIKSNILGWVVPLLPTITILIFDHSLYLPVNKNELQFYPTSWTLYPMVVAPIVLSILLYCIVFIAVLISIYKESHSKYTTEASKFRMKLLHILLSAFLCITIESTWLFGFLSGVLLPNSYTLCWILFCVTATIQGLILLFYFIVFDLRSFFGNVVIDEMYNYNPMQSTQEN